jgi:hypothetical protein
MTMTTLNFPPRRREVEGKWAPLMFEPILGSGERFAVAVVALLNGETHIKTAPALDRFGCLYGHASQDVLLAIQITLDEIRSRATSVDAEVIFKSELASSNAIFGEQRSGNGSSVDEVLDGALRLCSSFANWSPIASEIEDLAEVPEALEKTAPSSYGAHETQLVKQVSSYVSQRNHRLRSAFSHRFRASKSGRASKIDFAGHRLVANLRQIHTGRHLSGSVDRGKAGLLDLEIYRGERRQDLFQLSHHTLFLHVPSQATRPELSGRQIKHVEEAVEELTAIAHKQDLEAIALTSTNQIGDAILRMELPQLDAQF